MSIFCQGKVRNQGKIYRENDFVFFESFKKNDISLGFPSTGKDWFRTCEAKSGTSKDWSRT